jgi:hypothetical protein
MAGQATFSRDEDEEDRDEDEEDLDGAPTGSAGFLAADLSAVPLPTEPDSLEVAAAEELASLFCFSLAASEAVPFFRLSVR